MKKVLLSMTLFAALFITACGDEKAEEGKEKKDNTEAKAQESEDQATTLNINTDASKVEWKLGNKMDSSYFHTGYVNISGGSATVENGQIVSGAFEINMGSITNTDLEGGKKSDLEGHLKSDDFFKVSEYPVASFEITSVNGNTITGDLTVIGNTTEVTFDADINLKDQNMVADASLMVDRFDIGIDFMSEKDGTPEEKRLQQYIQFDVHIEASK